MVSRIIDEKEVIKMGIFNVRSIHNKVLILAIAISITFFFYRIVDVSINYDFVANHYHEFHHTQIIEHNHGGINQDLVSNHTFEPETKPNLTIDVNLDFDKFYGEDKGNLFYLIILLVSFLLIHLIVIQLYFLYFLRWLKKTCIILERYTLFIINYVHRKDGKKRHYPLYVHC